MLKYKELTKKCSGQRPTAISGSTRSPPRCDMSWCLLYTCPDTDPVSVSIRFLNWVFGSSPSLFTTSGSWALAFHEPLVPDNAAAFLTSSGRETSRPQRESFCTWHSCFQTVGPSCPPCQIVPWSWIMIAEQLKFEFPLHWTEFLSRWYQKQSLNLE